MTGRVMAGRMIRLAIVLATVVVVTGVALAEDPGESSDQKPVENSPSSVRVVLSFGLEMDRESRALVSPQEHFSTDHFGAREGSVICLSRVMNMTPPAIVTHVWYHEGKTMSRIDLKVGSADWRTWSSKRILPAWRGRWEVKVLDDEGMVLSSAGFVVD